MTTKKLDNRQLGTLKKTTKILDKSKTRHVGKLPNI